MNRSRAHLVALLAVPVSIVAIVGCGTGVVPSSPAAGGGTVPPSAASAAPGTTTPSSPVDPAIGVSTSPVVATYEVQQSSFEGFPVLSYVPDHPVGVVYLFHGTGGDDTFATRIETVDVLNELVARGYAFVATESANRSTKQWNTDDPSIDTNADLARMSRLRQNVIDTTAVDPTTPTYGIGMSNGAAFVALWAAASTKAGQPVAAIAMYMAPVTKATQSIGGVPVPTFMVTGATDSITNPTNEKASLDAIAAKGIPTEYHQVPERNVVAARYLRIPGVDQATADGIVHSLQQAGWIDASGKLLIDPAKLAGADEERALPAGAVLPSSLTPVQQADVPAETKAAIGEHQFNAEFKAANADFFNAHR
jgi:predicted esterase